MSAEPVPVEQDSFVTLVAQVYRAAGDPSHWPDALALLASIAGSGGAALTIGRGPEAGSSITPAYSPDAELAAQLAAHATRGSRSARASGTLLDDELADGTPVVVASVIFDAQLTASLVVAATPGSTATATVQRALPHLQNALRMGARLVELESRSRVLGDLIDRVNLGVFLVEHGHRVVLANTLARRLVHARDGVELRDGALSVHGDGQTERLDRLVEGALAVAAGRGAADATGGRLVVDRGADRPPLNVYVTPLIPRESTVPPARPHAVVFVVDPAPNVATLSEVLQTAFGLTFAEARLAARITSGLTVDQASRQLNISVNTARSQLKAVFAKTGVGRQAELVRLLLLLAMPMPGDHLNG